MEEILFEGIRCYKAFKVLYSDGNNFKKNYTYRFNKWYYSKDLNKDIKEECGAGLNLFKDIWSAFAFIEKQDLKGVKIFYGYIPCADNAIVYPCGNKIRCHIYYQTDIDIGNSFDYKSYELTERQINLLCKYRADFDYKSYELTGWQIDLLREYRADFDYKSYELTGKQIGLLCRYRADFDYKSYELTESQIGLLCMYRMDFDYKSYTLTERQINLLCEYRPDFDYKSYELTEWQIGLLCEYRPDFDYKSYELTEWQIGLLRENNKNYMQENITCYDTYQQMQKECKSII